MYARWAGRAAQRANEIAIHNERLRIYKGLLEFRAMLMTRGPNFPDDELWKIADLALLSEFYFSEAAHNAMQKLVKNGNEVKARYEHWQATKESRGDIRTAVQAMNELHRATRDECGVVAEILKPNLLLHKNKPMWFF
ncbi:MAG TPA: hypothetical protein VF679_03120 [Pedobacter sp.]